MECISHGCYFSVIAPFNITLAKETFVLSSVPTTKQGLLRDAQGTFATAHRSGLLES